MKKLLLLLIFPFCFSQIKAGNYQEMLKSGNKWNVLYNEIATCGGAFAYTTSLELTGDTVIESQTYKKMRGILFTEDRNKVQFRDTMYLAGLREDVQEQKVYVRYPNKEEELLYNFNVDVGDTIKIFDVYKSYEFTYKTIRFVSAIDSETINGTIIKKISLSDTLYTDVYRSYNNTTEHYKEMRSKYEWYEGIGTLQSPIELSTSNLVYHRIIGSRIKQCLQSKTQYSDFGYSLQCFWNGNSLLYHNPDPLLTECEYAYTVGIKDQFIEGISVFPNPTKGVVEIKSESGVEWAELFDSIGNRIMTTTQTTLDLSSLPRGIYFIRVTTLSGKIKTVKILKQ
ncbi:MAG: T9SS type A sorting domain-containing protein [Bacteroidales bacterium]